jgi:hypothetical protein
MILPLAGFDLDTLASGGFGGAQGTGELALAESIRCAWGSAALGHVSPSSIAVSRAAPRHRSPTQPPMTTRLSAARKCRIRRRYIRLRGIISSIPLHAGAAELSEFSTATTARILVRSLVDRTGGWLAATSRLSARRRDFSSAGSSPPLSRPASLNCASHPRRGMRTALSPDEG